MKHVDPGCWIAAAYVAIAFACSCISRANGDIWAALGWGTGAVMTTLGLWSVIELLGKVERLRK